MAYQNPQNPPYSIKVKQQVLKMYKEGANLKDITTMCGVSRRHIGRWAKEARIGRKRGQRSSQNGTLNPSWNKGKRKYSKDIEIKAIHLYQTGFTYKEVAKQLGEMSPWTIGIWVRAKDVSRTNNICKGKNHWNWQGGIAIEQRDRGSCKYKTWRKAVYKRDNYTCQICGKKGGKLIAHHEFPWKPYPNLRFNIDNGWTVCNICHSKKDNIGFKILGQKNRGAA